MTGSRVLLSDAEKSSRQWGQAHSVDLWTLVVALGAALTVVGWTDLALLWYPLQFGDAQWEFATISGTFDGLPLGTIGIALLLAGAAGKGWRRRLRVLGVVCLLVTIVLLAISVVYLLDVPVAMRSTPPEVKPILKKAMLKAGAFALTYTMLYGWLGWFLWRNTRRTKA